MWFIQRDARTLDDVLAVQVPDVAAVREQL
jgi:hypothetical protein